MRQQVNGILLLDKPAGFTSNGALQRVKRLFNAKKAGHTGSLDPIATGMLPLCFGEATKFSQFLLESDKSYYVTAQLGVETTTGDSEGTATITKPVTEEITAARIQQVISQFIGEQDQIPPMYSAIKIQGRPLYELARKGIEVERQSRRIRVISIEMVSFRDAHFSINVHCSKGTYIRTLIQDIGRELGCGAHVIELRRTMVNPYTDHMMYSLASLEAIAESAGQAALQACLLPVETAVNIFPVVTLSTAAAFYLRQGQPVRATLPIDSSLVRLLSEDARFLGVGEVMNDGRVKPHRLVV